MPESREQEQGQVSKESQAENATVPLDMAKQKMKDILRSKRAWGMLAVILFLLAGGTLVPVGRIPLLRNLVYAMGYTPEETLRLSLFQALFSWNEHQKILRGEIPDPNELDVFGSAEAATRAAELAARKEGRLKDALINMGAVNASLRRQGRGAEQVAGSSGGIDADREDGAQVVLNNSNASTNTESNVAQVSDVYFGADVNGVRRDKRDGYDSVNSLKKAASPIRGASGSSNTDWVVQMADKATRQDAQLSGINDNLEAKGLSAGLGQVEKVGKDKARRDLYWAWLTGRAARRTPQVILKKTLASSSFDGAELPKTVFMSSGFSGIGVNPDDVIADMSSVKKYLELDEKCNNTLKNEFNDDYEKQLKEMRGEIAEIGASFPANCAQRANSAAFTSKLTSVQNACNNMRAKYNKLQTSCSSVSVKNRPDQCHERFPTLTTDFSNYCQELYDEISKKCATESDPAACEQKERESVDAKTLQDAKNAGKVYYEGDSLQAAVNSGYFKDTKPSDENEYGLSDSYFPTGDWGQSLWVDENAID